MDRTEVFGHETPLIGMVHLSPLPGAPNYGGDRAAVRSRARSDARALEAGGVDAVLVENYGDTPYVPDSVPPHTVAEMTALTREVGTATEGPVGVNVLRNDAAAAVSIAGAAGGSFVRVNCHAGVTVTDQGLLEGAAHETARLRERIGADVAVLADVDVKHGRDLGDRSVRSVARDALERAAADGLIVSGPSTGRPPDPDVLRAVADGRDDLGSTAPVLVGSGTRPENVAELLAVADGAIVGTSLKRDGVTAGPVDPERVEAVVEAAGRG